jgi:hypothetical protein
VALRAVRLSDEQAEAGDFVLTQDVRGRLARAREGVDVAIEAGGRMLDPPLVRGHRFPDVHEHARDGVPIATQVRQGAEDSFV